MVVGGDERAQRPKPRRHFVEDRAVARGGRHFLIEPRDAQPGRAPDRAAVQRNLAGNGLQKTGLAAAVAADERNPLSRLDAQVRVLEERQMAEGEMALLKVKEGHA